MFLFCSFLSASYHYTQAQSSPYEALRECGVSDETPSYAPESEPNFCFDVETIQESCIKVWIRVNLHFFLDDDCDGTLDPLGVQNIPGDDAYKLAEDIITRANSALENNRKQWAQNLTWGINPADEKPEQCVPIRYVLSGVYIWCNSIAQSTSGFNIPYFQNNFGQNIDTEYNAYYVNVPGGPNGVANGQPGNAFTGENFGVSVFNHEMGHVLSLLHTDLEDHVSDTPRIRFQYDYNCDGDLTDNFPDPGVGWEGRWRQCFDNLIHSDVTYDRSLDYDGDGVTDYADLCNMPAPCDPYPCCDWDYVNNNIMAYSRYTECCAAYTEGQITRILENLSTNTYCAYIEEITDDCPPPMANIHVLSNEGDVDDCSFCLYLSASMHDDYYQADFYESDGSFFYSTGFLSGPANRFCISRTVAPPYGYLHGFQPGETYTAVLRVENYCGDEAEEALTFTFEAVECAAEDPAGRIAITGKYPNPFSSALQVDFTTEEAGHLEIWLIPAAGGIDVLAHSEYLDAPGNYQRTLSAGQVSVGTHYLALCLDGEMIAETVIKQ
ncbi:MAG: hypothetical protein H6557_13290 [Lewinellaceae bacterium]|nr:hypothetical protein [Phaeodactylibacter sp.]MCB9037581.1 hypothetical protein [Lewinellaceae bacterium]